MKFELGTINIFKRYPKYEFEIFKTEEVETPLMNQYYE